jgi:hypothetical protein
MPLVYGVARPSEQGVVDQHPGVELGDIIVEHARQSERRREQP